MKSKKKTKYYGGANNNLNEKFEYNYNPSNEQQALESVNNNYVRGIKEKFKFGRGYDKRFLNLDPYGEGLKRLENGLGIRVKNLTNESRNEYLSKPKKYKRSK